MKGRINHLGEAKFIALLQDLERAGALVTGCWANKTNNEDSDLRLYVSIDQWLEVMALLRRHKLRRTRSMIHCSIRTDVTNLEISWVYRPSRYPEVTVHGVKFKTY
jgi:hypothetical protein